MRKIQAFCSMMEKHILETENTRGDNGEMPDDKLVPQGEEDTPF